MKPTVLPHLVNNVPRQKTSTSRYITSKKRPVRQLYTREIMEAAELEVAMPMENTRVDHKTRLDTIILLLGSLLVIFVYIGIPIIMVANAFVDNIFTAMSFTLTILLGGSMFILGILVETTAIKRRVQQRIVIPVTQLPDEVPTMFVQLEESNV